VLFRKPLPELLGELRRELLFPGKCSVPDIDLVELARSGLEPELAEPVTFGDGLRMLLRLDWLDSRDPSELGPEELTKAKMACTAGPACSIWGDKLGDILGELTGEALIFVRRDLLLERVFVR